MAAEDQPDRKLDMSLDEIIRLNKMEQVKSRTAPRQGPKATTTTKTATVKKGTAKRAPTQTKLPASKKAKGRLSEYSPGAASFLSRASRAGVKLAPIKTIFKAGGGTQQRKKKPVPPATPIANKVAAAAGRAPLTTRRPKGVQASGKQQQQQQQHLSGKQRAGGKKQPQQQFRAPIEIDKRGKVIHPQPVYGAQAKKGKPHRQQKMAPLPEPMQRKGEVKGMGARTAARRARGRGSAEGGGDAMDVDSGRGTARPQATALRRPAGGVRKAQNGAARRNKPATLNERFAML